MMHDASWLFLKFYIRLIYKMLPDYLMPYFLLNLSTRPLVSTSFCLPV